MSTEENLLAILTHEDLLEKVCGYKGKGRE